MSSDTLCGASPPTATFSWEVLYFWKDSPVGPWHEAPENDASSPKENSLGGGPEGAIAQGVHLHCGLEQLWHFKEVFAFQEAEHKQQQASGFPEKSEVPLTTASHTEDSLYPSKPAGAETKLQILECAKLGPV